MSEILVVTCPGGKQCSYLLPLLYNKGKFKLRLAAHSPSSASRLREKYPDAEVVQVDLASPAACASLLRGATSVYHVGPSLNSREKEIGFNMVDAAAAEAEQSARRSDSSSGGGGGAAFFQHFVFSSVHSTQHRMLMQHDLKSYVEERLFLSPLNYTVLQPTNFLDYPVRELAGQGKEKEKGPVLEHMWDPDMPNSVIALRDLAEAAAKVLNEREAHYFAQYPLCSTMPVSDAEIARAIARGIGRTVAARKPTYAEGVNFGNKVLYDGRGAAEGDLRPDICRDGLERLVLFYNHRGLRGSPNVLRWLLGREPTTVDEYVKLELEAA